MEYIKTATREFPTGPSLTLTVDARSGTVIIAGDDVELVTVQIVGHIWEESGEAADDTFARVLAGLQHARETLRIESREQSASGPWFLFGRGSRVDYTLTVPRQTVCHLSSRGGRIEVAEISGPLTVEQRSGRVSARGIGADVRIANRSGASEVEDIKGALVLDTHSGRTGVRGVGGDAQLNSHSGSLQVEAVAGSLTARSQSGRITAGEVGGAARLETSSGSILLTAAGGAANLRSLSGGIAFRGAVRGDLTIQSNSGSIRLEVDPEVPFFIDAESRSGSIQSDLPPRQAGAPPPAGGPTARLRTLSGSIRVSRQ